MNYTINKIESVLHIIKISLAERGWVNNLLLKNEVHIGFVLFVCLFVYSLLLLFLSDCGSGIPENGI